MSFDQFKKSFVGNNLFFSIENPHSFKLIRHERKISQYTSLLGERVRAYTWDVPQLIKAWVLAQYKESIIESNKSNE